MVDLSPHGQAGDVSRAAITAALRAEINGRRLHWIGGVPTAADLDAVARHVADRNNVSREVARSEMKRIAAGMEVVG